MQQGVNMACTKFNLCVTLWRECTLFYFGGGEADGLDSSNIGQTRTVLQNKVV